MFPSDTESVPAVPGVSVGGNHGLSSPSLWSSSDVSDSSQGSTPAPNWNSDVRVPCREPFVINGTVTGCGRCLACRSRAARIWGNRIMLEMSGYGENLFITLTYDDAHLPLEGSLHKRQFSAFIKRLRKRIEYHTKTRFRFFACGEYGTNTGRAHYHAILFGLGLWAEYIIRDCWKFGFSHILPADKGAGPYVAGYVVKKLNAVDRSPREPEFILMSRRPGIGGRFAEELADDCLKSGLWYDEYGDIVGACNVGKYKLALGGYIRKRVRTMLHGSPKAPPEKIAAQASAVLSVYEGAVENGIPASFGNEVKALQIERRFLRTRQNETL